MHERSIVLAAFVLSCLPAAGAPVGEVTFRARVVRLKPEQPARILWRYGGEGLGGDVTRGELTLVPPRAPDAPDVDIGPEAAEGLSLDEPGKRQDRIIETGQAADIHWLFPGTWSPAKPLSSVSGRRGRLFLTLYVQGRTTGAAITDSELEMEFLSGNSVLKRLRVTAPDGGTFGIVLPLHLLPEQGGPGAEFAEALESLLEYARRREQVLLAEPWAALPTPKRYSMVTDCFGYGRHSGYGVRTSDRETMLTEYRTLRLMGINGTRGVPEFILDLIRQQEGIGRELARARLVHTIGYPINTVKIADGKAPQREPGDGCPYHPTNAKGIPARVNGAIEHLREVATALPVDEIWALTVDEIGTVFDRSPERKSHMGCCPYCRNAFREMVREAGCTLDDFGATDWDAIRATYGYWTIDFWESKRLLQAAVEDAEKALKKASEAALGDPTERLGNDAGDLLDMGLPGDLTGTPAKSADQLTRELEAAKTRLHELVWNTKLLSVPEAERELGVSPRGWRLLEYYSRRFNNLSAAGLFRTLQEAAAAENAARAGTGQAPVYTYALRGNNFLMGGHSLDFFDFYRFADNAFVYETSNRDHRVWQWDTYLCDVGRSLNRFYDKRFGVYVKPHRGAPVQRALTAVARGARMVYWYTYGPGWAKGDTFAPKTDLLKRIGWFSRVLAAAEDVTYDSEWAVPAEVAIVRPRTSEFFSGSASWEDGKWIYTALMHAHIPVAPLDETLLLKQDLTAYKAIVICGSHIRGDVAERLRAWVSRGGTLVACGWGMAQDEACDPLDSLWPVFGVTARGEMDTWANVPRYGATRLGSVKQEREPPTGAVVKGAEPLQGTFPLAVGREHLQPADGADVVARYADGGAAVVRNRYGQGTAWLIGFYPGVEYAIETMNNQEFDAGKRSFIAAPVLSAGVRPVVDASDPLVDGVLLRNPRTGKHAVALINWRHHIDSPLTVAVRAPQGLLSVRSLALQQPLAAETQGDRTQGDSLHIELPRLDEGDILLLDFVTP